MKKFQGLGRALSKEDQKKVIGGYIDKDPGEGGDICLGCSTDSECQRVNKGNCVTLYCNKKQAKWCDMS